MLLEKILFFLFNLIFGFMALYFLFPAIHAIVVMFRDEKKVGFKDMIFCAIGFSALFAFWISRI